MTLGLLKKDFIKKLSAVYPVEEIGSFFNILSKHFLNLSRLQIALNKDREITDIEYLKFENAIHRLQNFEPIQYIIGECEFYGLTFRLNEFTLIPRPETEELVDWIIQDVKSEGLTPINVLDIGTGSGCIAISLGNEFQNSNITAIDFSKEALKIATKNALINNVPIEFRFQDILNTQQLDKDYDVIVSNPPYVRHKEKSQMQKNVLQHEPKMALFVGDDDPLVFYSKIAGLAKNALKNGGMIYVEINEYLSKDLTSLFDKAGFKNVEIKKDIFGKDRMIKAIKYA